MNTCGDPGGRSWIDPVCRLITRQSRMRDTRTAGCRAFFLWQGCRCPLRLRRVLIGTGVPAT